MSDEAILAAEAELDPAPKTVNVEMDPQARAWYSSNPAFLDGATERPDNQDTVDVVSLRHHSKKSNGIKDQELIAAGRYMRHQEAESPAESTETDIQVIHLDLAAKGVKWVRKNVDEKEIHDTAVQADKSLNGHLVFQGLTPLELAEDTHEEAKLEEYNKHHGIVQEVIDKNREILVGLGYEFEVDFSSIEDFFSSFVKAEVRGSDEDKTAFQDKIELVLENPALLKEVLLTGLFYPDNLNSSKAKIMGKYSGKLIPEIEKAVRTKIYEPENFTAEVMKKWVDLAGTLPADLSVPSSSNRGVYKHLESVLNDSDISADEGLAITEATNLGLELIYENLVATIDQAPGKFIDKLYEFATLGYEDPDHVLKKQAATNMIMRLLEKPEAAFLYNGACGYLKYINNGFHKVTDITGSVAAMGYSTSTQAKKTEALDDPKKQARLMQATNQNPFEKTSIEDVDRMAELFIQRATTAKGVATTICGKYLLRAKLPEDA